MGTDMVISDEKGSFCPVFRKKLLTTVSQSFTIEYDDNSHPRHCCDPDLLQKHKVVRTHDQTVSKQPECGAYYHGYRY